MTRPIRKLLIANRNEIAVRIIKAARSLGLSTVAVYSEADAQAMHVQLADEAYCLGPAPSLESYLRIDRLIEVAQRCGADAIHPGYGFVSENPALPKACAEAGIVLVGPGEQAMADMADKAQAKAIAQAAGLPCIEGFNKPEASVDDLLEAARRIGYPIMIKALAGGGGRGMRLVMEEADFVASLQSAQAEAQSAFGDKRVMLEKAVLSPRHVEIQVLADQFGHAIHLGERDCTVQRRHQKIVEEAPSPAVDSALRARMGEAALKLVAATHYVGAGTVEFLLNPEGEFFFIEMNTRLQVEHGVTELITGVDLVQWQLKIAAGLPLTLQQQDIQWTGHAIQGRLCAEDPGKDFLPQTGPVIRWSIPQAPHIRIDHAIIEGAEVSPWYDSMLAKVMVHAPNRQQACVALSDALSRTELVGFEHNIEYLQRIAEHAVFQSGEFSTAYLGQYGSDLLQMPSLIPADAQAVASVILATQRLNSLSNGPVWPPALQGFSSTRALDRPTRLRLGGHEGKPQEWRVSAKGRGQFLIHPAGSDAALELSDWQCQTQAGGFQVRCQLNGDSKQFVVLPQAGGLWVKAHRAARALWVEDHTLLADASQSEGQFQAQVKSPMNGKLTRMEVQVGQVVKAGEVLACLEAMKMEHRMTARHDAVVEAVLAEVGQQLGRGQLLLTLKPINI